MAISGITTAFLLLIITYLPAPFLYLGIIGFGILAFTPPVVFALVSEVILQEKSSSGLRILFTFIGAGNLAGQFLIGILRYHHNGMILAFTAIQSFSLATFVVSMI